jgi:chitinase
VQAYVPIIALVTPQSGAALDSNTTVPVTALVGYGTGSGTVSSVAFTAIGDCGASPTVNLGAVTAAPYTVQWMNPPAGHYFITAAADDSSFPTVTIPSYDVEVTAGPNSVPPPCPTPPPPAPAALPAVI